MALEHQLAAAAVALSAQDSRLRAHRFQAVVVVALTDTAGVVLPGQQVHLSLPVLQTLVVEGMVARILALVRLVVPGMH